MRARIKPNFITGKTYDQWVSEVDAIVGETIGCSVLDVPDLRPLLWDWYNDYVPPNEAAMRAIGGGE